MKNVKVGNETESDHRSIELTLERRIKMRKKENEVSREIKDWTKEGRKKYQQKLEERKEFARKEHSYKRMGGTNRRNKKGNDKEKNKNERKYLSEKKIVG